MDAIGIARGVMDALEDREEIAPPAPRPVLPPAPRPKPVAPRPIPVTPKPVAPAPRPIAVPTTPVVPPKPVAPRPVPPKPTPGAIPVLKWPTRANTRTIERLSAHLEDLQEIQGEDDEPSKELQLAMDRLAAKIADWEMEIEDMQAGSNAQKEPTEAQLEKWEAQLDVLVGAREHLEAGSIEEAIDTLSDWE